jgi:histidine phosphotransferase ChpT
MRQHIDNLAALIGSRICHDLISPIGAVANGLELMALSAAIDGPELDLVNESAANANARIRLFRLAFGQATPGQTTRGDEVGSILRDVYGKSRLAIEWLPPPSFVRPEAQALVLAILCCEQALPQGGTITLTQGQKRWTVRATGPQIKADRALWANLGRPYPDCDVAPAQVQFALLPHLMAERGKTCTFEITDTFASVTL